MNKKLLYKFFEGTASISEQQEIRNWMESSPENKQELFRERKLFDAILFFPHPEKIAAKSISFIYYARQISQVAIIVGITFFISILYQRYKENKHAQSMQQIYVPSGQRVNLTLPDGTSVWLNARTTLQYPLSFAKNKRKVKLNGEAYFEVSKNKNHPFIVETEKYNVEVFGTTFNIEAYSQVDKFETSLITGKVKLTNTTNPAETVELYPKTKAFLKSGKLVVDSITDYNTYLWKDGLICFRNKPFIEIMYELTKYYGINIQVKNKFVYKYKFTGKFRQSDGIDYALRVLQKDIQFNYERDDEKQIIYIK